MFMKERDDTNADILPVIGVRELVALPELFMYLRETL